RHAPPGGEPVGARWRAARARARWRYMGMRVESPAGLARWIDARGKAGEAGTGIPFVHRDAATGAAFGSTSLFDIDLPNKRMEIGHKWLGASHRRTAANTESKLLMFAHAFDALGAERVQLKTDVENLRSQAAIARRAVSGSRAGYLSCTLRRNFVRTQAASLWRCPSESTSMTVGWLSLVTTARVSASMISTPRQV